MRDQYVQRSCLIRRSKSAIYARSRVRAAHDRRRVTMKVEREVVSTVLPALPPRPSPDRCLWQVAPWAWAIQLPTSRGRKAETGLHRAGTKLVQTASYSVSLGGFEILSQSRVYPIHSVHLYNVFETTDSRLLNYLSSVWLNHVQFVTASVNCVVANATRLFGTSKTF